MPQQIPSQIGSYQIVEIAGRWAMGWLYRGFDWKRERNAVVKKLCPPWAGEEIHRVRFEQEARATARLYHPNILTCLDFGYHDGDPFITFEVLEGKSLLQLMNAGMSLKVSLPAMLHVLDGLAHMHERGIIHRDIKPAHIFVCTDGRAMITDLWMAARVQPPMKPGWTGLLLGTPSYLSPEQVRCQAFDGRTDLFSLGCVLYEMVAGEKPFGGEASSALLSKIISEQPDMESIPHGPEWERLRGVITRALQKKPEDRYPDASAMRTDLELALKELGDSAGDSRERRSAS
jgi:serine/threonine-protein kinase